MKTITIDFSGDNVEFLNGRILGCEGIHNSVTLRAILPENLICKEIKSYNMIFRNGEGEIVISEELLLEKNSVSCVLWEQLLCGNELSVQVQGVGFENGEVTVIDKTPVAELEIERSIDGERVESDINSHSVSAQLAVIKDKLAMIEILGSINGVCLSQSQINSEGELILTYSNGKSYNIGTVKGESGRDGINGRDGKDGIDGINGKDGIDGKDGADGLNGADGKDGYIPVKGIDYWTVDDITKINDDNIAFISSELAKRNQLKPEFANDTSECTDISKLYVLPDGYVYAYMKAAVVDGGYSNKAEPPEKSNTTDTTKWVDGWRLSDVGAISAQDGSTLSNKIYCSVGDKIRVKGAAFRSSKDRYGCYTADNAAIKTSVGYVFNANGPISTAYVSVEQETDETYVFTPIDVSDNANLAYMRFVFTTPTNPSDVIITVNEPIAEPVITYQYTWASTGHAFVPADYENRITDLEIGVNDNANRISNVEQEIGNTQVELGVDIMSLDGRVTRLEGNNATIPDYWEESLAHKITYINELHEQYGKDCFSFVVMTDMHYPSNPGRIAPLLAKRIMDECGIRYALCLGDTQTRGCWSTVEELRAENKAILEMLEPVKDSLLRTQGNHDGNYGKLEDGTTYVYRITPQELHNHIYRRVGLVGDAHFDESGSGYWIDDTANKVRYVVLNCHNTAYELNDDGTQKYPNMKKFRFGQSQYDMVIDALNTIPSSSWSLIFAGHVALGVNGGHSHWGNGDEATADCTLMDNLLSAYKRGEQSFAGTFGTEAEYDYVKIEADFIDKEERGTIIGFFGGHTHLDLNTRLSGSVINRITTRCDAKEENDSTLKAERVKGTITEQSFDVFTVDTKSRKIYATKIGAGSNREIDY